MSHQNQKTSASKPILLLVKHAFALSAAVSGSLFFCLLLPQCWQMPLWKTVLLVAVFCLVLYWPIYLLVKNFFTGFSKNKAEFLNIGLILFIAVSFCIGFLSENLYKMVYLPDVNLQVSLQSASGNNEDLFLESPRVILGTQDISPQVKINDTCRFEDDILVLSVNEPCLLSYPVAISRNDTLQITLTHTEYPVNAQVNIRHISHAIALSEIDGNTIQINETITPSFSPKKIRYPVWAATLYFWIIFLSLALYALGKTSFYEKTSQFLQKHKMAANILVTGIFGIVALIYTANRLTSNVFHFPSLYSDAANIASFAAAYAHPENFARDPFLSDPSNYQGYFALHVPLIRGLGALTGNYATAFLVLLFPTILLQLFGYYLLGKHLFNNRLFAFLLSVSTIFSVSLPYFSYEFFGLYGDIIPRVLFQALLPYALILLSRIITTPKRWWLGSVMFILLFYVHPVSGPNWLIALFLSYLLIMLLQFNRFLWMPMITSLLISIAGLIPFVQAFFIPSSNETPDLALIKEIYAYRLSSQTSDILHLFRYFIKMQIAPFSTEIFLWISSFIFLLVTTIYIAKNLKGNNKWIVEDKNHLVPVLLFVWWLATLVSCIVIPLIDELYTNSSGNLPVLREIRRNIRYLLPLTWITFFWIIQAASSWSSTLKQRSASLSLQANLTIFALVLSGVYLYQVKPFSDPVIQQSITCLQQGKIVCNDSDNISEKVAFYDRVCDTVQPDELIFPDPSPSYLGDTLIPRYYCMRSIAYSYKDGGSTGNTTMTFTSDWWETTKQLEMLLPTPESSLNLDVLKIAQSKQADYFIFISPDEQILSNLNSDQIVFQNDYGVLYQLIEE